MRCNTECRAYYNQKTLFEGTKHKQKLKTVRTVVQPIDSLFKKVAPREGDKLKIAEKKIAAFIAEHNLSYRVADHILSKSFTNSNAPKNWKLKRTKVQAIINNVIAQTEKETLWTVLKVTKFLVFIDESTDVAVVGKQSSIYCIYVYL